MIAPVKTQRALVEGKSQDLSVIRKSGEVENLKVVVLKRMKNAGGAFRTQEEEP